jgi:putative hemolysin
MSQILWQIFIVFILTVLNGFFVLSEIALISIRKTRVAELAKKGNKRARIIQQLHHNPESLFATTQVGVSIITIFASAFAGASIAEKLVPYLTEVPIHFVSANAYNFSFIIVVAFVTYLSLIIGELVPKSLGLRYAESFSLVAAYPIWLLSKIISLPILLLTFSSNVILKLFRDSTSFSEGRLSEEEIRALIAEGRKVGSIEAHEHSIIENVFDFSDLNVEKIMVSRAKMVAYDISEPAEEIITKAIESGYSRIPMYQGEINNIIGVLYTKKLLGTIGRDPATLDLKDFLVPPYFVPAAMKIGNVLRLLQRKKAHMALVTDEHGEIEGLVTLEDILEEIVGEITDETDEVSQGIKRIGRDFLVTGDVSVVDFNKYFNVQLSEEEDYNTVSGFILDQLGHFPNAGETVVYQGAQFIVKEAAMRTVKTVLIQGVKRNQ